MFFADNHLTEFHVAIDGDSLSWCDERERAYLDRLGKPDSEVSYGKLTRGDVTRDLIFRKWYGDGVTYEYKREAVESVCDLWVREGKK
jgi:hypothetical protein